MPKKLLAVLALLAAIAAVIAVGFALAPDSAIRPIAADSPCPVDGVHEMTCPEASCASVECHGWETLGSRYHQASDASLNLWILMPVVLVVALVGITRKVGRS